MKKFLTKLGNYKLLQRHSNNDIPTKILKENSEVFARYFHKNKFLNWELDFPVWFKVASVIPAFKKRTKTSKDNYRPISILPNISKIYERCLYNQMQTYFDNIASKYQCGFCGFNAQNCLVSMIENGKKLWIMVGCLALLWQTSLKLLTVYIMNY